MFHCCSTAKKYEELHPKEKKKGSKEKDAKKESKKVEKPKEKKPEELAPPAPKEKKDPFCDLPPPKMVFDDWKRMYRNNDTATVAIPWFWDNIDKEGKCFTSYQVFCILFVVNVLYLLHLVSLCFA